MTFNLLNHKYSISTATTNPTASMDASHTSPWTVQTIPAELLDLIILWTARMEGAQKNHFLQRRLLCKAFDKAIRPLVFKGLQLETTMFMRSAKEFQIRDLVPVGDICQAMYLDLMVVRDEEEANSLINIFQGSHPLLPEMEPLSALFRQYCMGEHTFDEMDFRSQLVAVVERTPNLKRFRVNLPVQVVGGSNLTSTLLLATTLSVLANNSSEDHKPLETLVIDHLSVTTVNRICHNHMDLTNCLSILQFLKHLVLSLKASEVVANGNVFACNLWFLLRQADSLESLCLVGWNARRDVVPQETENNPGRYTQALPYYPKDSVGFRNLRFLELKRLSIEGPSLIKVITEAATSLKELYLDEVCLKVCSESQEAVTSLWIGDWRRERYEGTCWVATKLRDVKGLKLEILRAKNLGYDDEPNRQANPAYDFEDPAELSRPFDQRFVDAVMDPNHPSGRADTCYPEGHPGDLFRPAELPWLCDLKPEVAYDAEVYQTTVNNPTSVYKNSIDGLFLNHNESALKQLGSFVSMADRVMGLMSEWVESARRTAIDERTGSLMALAVSNLPGNAHPPNSVNPPNTGNP